MNDALNCQRCGLALPRRAPEGLCPRCLMESAVRLALADGGRTEDAGAEKRMSDAAPPRPPPPALSGRFGNYELIERIAAGGMGVVYKARQLGLERIVAIKVLPFGAFTRDEFVRRFQLEAGAAARLRHPNIVTIYEVGQADGFPFFSMEYVEGATLAGLARGGPLEPGRAVRLVRAVAEAIHYAHQQGILHRDLKPSNVLVDALDQPRITDFGLARNLADDSELTLSGQALGSPNFMPPEQAEGRSADIGTRSDVYALGAMLYFLLIGRPPFAADSAVATLRQVVQNDPAAPRLLNPGLPRDLETICLRCLEKEPSRRYATAQEVAEELGRFQLGEPIVARPITTLERAWRWCGRRPAVASLLALLIAVVAAGFAATIGQWRRAEHSVVRLAETVTHLEIDRAEDRLARGESSEALAQLAGVLRREPQNRVAAARLVAALSQRRFLLPAGTLIQDDFVGRNSAFAQHGNWLVTATNRGTMLQLWDTRDGLRLERLLPCGEPVRVASFRGDGRQLVAATANGNVLLFEIPDRRAPARREPNGRDDHERAGREPGAPVAGPHRIGGYIDRIVLSPDGAQTIAHLSGPNSDDWTRARLMIIESVTGQALRTETNAHWAAFSPDGKWLVTVGGREARLRNPSTWEAISPPLRHGARINTAEFSPDSRLLVTASADSTARIWRVETGERLGGPMRHDLQVLAAVFSPDGKRVFTRDIGRSGRLWDSATGQPAGPGFEHVKGISRESFSADSALVVTSTENKIRLRDAATGALGAEPLDPGDAVARARFIGARRQILVSSFSGEAQLWNAPANMARGHRLAHRAEISAVAVSSDASFIAVGLKTTTAHVWNAKTGEAVASLAHRSQVSRIAFDPGGTRLVTASLDAARVWELPSGRLLSDGLRHQGVVFDAGFSPDGRWMMTCSEDGTARLWNADTFQPASPPLRHRGDVRGAAFHPDGKILATAGTDNTVRLWSVPEGNAIGEPLRHSNWVIRAVFSPNGKMLASCGAENGARMWIWSNGPARPGEPASTVFLRHEAHVDSVQFDRAGERVVTASDDGTARIWDTATGEMLARPLRHDGNVIQAAFSPDDRWVLTASNDGTARVWDAATGHPVTDPLRHEGLVTSACWSPLGDFVATGSFDRTVRMWPMEFLSLGAAPAWLPDLAEAVGGKRLLEKDLHAPVKPAEFLRLRQSLLERAEPEAYRRWLEGFLGTAAGQSAAR